MEAAPRSPEHREVSDQEAEWGYEKIDGRWQFVKRKELPPFGRDHKEQERRDQNLVLMYREMREQWKMDDPEAIHNEGILRDHPRYPELLKKWGMRYLRKKGFGLDVYSGEINDDYGQLKDAEGRNVAYFINEIRHGREWVDEYIEAELLMSEGFVDITNDDERQEALGIEPSHSGWWTEEEI